MNKAVGEENKQLVDFLKAYDFSFILSGERVDPSESMQVTLSNLGIKNTQNTLIYQMEEASLFVINCIASLPVFTASTFLTCPSSSIW